MGSCNSGEGLDLVTVFNPEIAKLTKRFHFSIQYVPSTFFGMAILREVWNQIMS